jgi:hypothetical protein
MENEKEFNHGEQKMTSTLNLEGEAVRVSIGNGSFLHGDVQEVNAEQVKVRGRWFPLSAVQTEEEVEQFMKANIAEDRRRSRAEQEAVLAAEIALHGEPKVPVMLSEKKELTAAELSDFVSYLLRTGYRLHLAAREDGLEQALEEYRTWTDGSELPEDCIYMNDTAFTAREWFLEFHYDDSISYPFPIIEMGTVGRGSKSEPRGLHHSGRVTACYTEIAEFAVRSGVRARNAEKLYVASVGERGIDFRSNNANPFSLPATSCKCDKYLSTWEIFLEFAERSLSAEERTAQKAWKESHS